MKKYNFVRKEAVCLLEELNLENESYIDVFKVIDGIKKHYNITVVGTDLKKLDGFTLKKDENYLLAYDNVNFHEHRIRFSIAHEIGHILLGHFNSSCVDDDYYRRIKDKEANVFAGTLLMPSKILYLKNAKNKFEIADELSVSPLSLEYRVNNLNKIAENYTISICKNCDSLIYQKGEVHYCGHCGIKIS